MGQNQSDNYVWSSSPGGETSRRQRRAHEGGEVCYHRWACCCLMPCCTPSWLFSFGAPRPHPCTNWVKFSVEESTPKFTPSVQRVFPAGRKKTQNRPLSNPNIVCTARNAAGKVQKVLLITQTKCIKVRKLSITQNRIVIKKPVNLIVLAFDFYDFVHETQTVL